MSQPQKMLSLEYIQQAILNPNQDEKCIDLHTGSCNTKSLKQFASGCAGMYKMYLLVHIIPLLLFKRKKIANDPLFELRKLIVNLAKSLLFAAGYSMLVRRIICFLTQHAKYSSVAAIISGSCAGISLIFEPVSRQSEIALYTLNKSMEVLYNMGLRRNLPVRMPKGECILNGVAVAILGFVYMMSPEHFRESYRKALDQLLKDV